MARTIQPPGWPRPRGYSNGMAARGEILAIAGQIGWDENERLVGHDFLPQFAQALRNVRTVVRAAGGDCEHVVSMTIFVTDRSDYLGNLADVGRVYREIMGRHFPAMALVEVSALLEPGAVVEIQALAVLPAPEETSP
ncbi:MAG: RidA family protein [Deltaproteobacteria bacterium]|nr:MAG: RidA family protein [Deltaproteobacteria bacterium]